MGFRALRAGLLCAGWGKVQSRTGKSSQLPLMEVGVRRPDSQVGREPGRPLVLQDLYPMSWAGQVCTGNCPSKANPWAIGRVSTDDLKMR